MEWNVRPNSKEISHCKLYKCVTGLSNMGWVKRHCIGVGHGQGAAERGFSMKKKVLNVNIHEISITSRKLINDHMIIQMLSTKIPGVLKRKNCYGNKAHSALS